MEINTQRFNRVDLVSVSGRLDASNADKLRKTIEGLFGEGRYRIVLDLEQLEYISSPGLRVLIEARKKAREWTFGDRDNGDIRIAALPSRIRDVFDLTGFTSLFEIFPDRLAAVGSY